MQTRWRIRAVPDLPQRLDVELIVDTEAPAVIQAIEEAAATNGVQLERLEPAAVTPPPDRPGPDWRAIP
jgi:hypothetical protein